MTISPAHPPIVATGVQAAVDAVRDQGLRLSSARRLVIEALAAAHTPVTAEQIAAGVDGRVPRSDLASVYRNLDTLEDVGIVRHMHLGHGPGLYALSGTGRREYLTCEACGMVRAMDPADLDAVRQAIHDCSGFHARFDHFPISGLCPGCAEAGEGEHARL